MTFSLLALNWVFGGLHAMRMESAKTRITVPLSYQDNFTPEPIRIPDAIDETDENWWDGSAVELPRMSDQRNPEREAEVARVCAAMWGRR